MVEKILKTKKFGTGSHVILPMKDFPPGTEVLITTIINRNSGLNPVQIKEVEAIVQNSLFKARTQY